MVQDHQILINDVWYSADGINWVEATSANWPARSRFTSTIFTTNSGLLPETMVLGKDSMMSGTPKAAV